MLEERHLALDRVIVPDPLTADAILWLQERQPDFSATLAEVGERHGVGIEIRRKPWAGQFTGAGLCSWAVGVQEEALVRKYGSKIETAAYFLYCFRRDMDTYDTEMCTFGYPQPIMPHWILLFKAAGTREWYFADPTFRQLAIETNPDLMLVGVSEAFIESTYKADWIYCQKRAAHAVDASVYEPKMSQRRLYALRLEAIRSRRAVTTEEEYCGLLEVFK